MRSAVHSRTHRGPLAQGWRPANATSLVIASLVACVTMFVLVKHAPKAAWIALVGTLVVSFALEAGYRKRTGRRSSRLPEPTPAGTPSPA